MNFITFRPSCGNRRVRRSDRQIDSEDNHINEECLKMLALHQPVAGDLRRITAAMMITTDLERMGDLAEEIAERAIEMAKTEPPSEPSYATGSNPAKSEMKRTYWCPASTTTSQSCLSASRLARYRRAIAMPSSRGMLKRAKLASPSPLQRDRSCIEYFDSKMARVIRAIRDSATVPLSEADLGMKPQQAAAKTAASKCDLYSRS